MTPPLTPEERARLADLFDRAVDLPLEEHAGFVEEECAASPALAAELSRLLAAASGEDRLARLRPAPPTREGTRVGAYELLERIGEGGMGEVYAAEQHAPVERRVAVKIIKPGMDSAAVLARFEMEQRTLAILSHPNVAQVFDGGRTEDGLPYFVMELVPGVPITEYCDAHRLAMRARLELVLDVCKGVEHAHQKGILHRDLKPSNLLVMEREGRAVAKVIDFGVARAIGGELADDVQHTIAGQVIGTLDYMSPEQADPSRAGVDTRTDVYSLGVVLYELLSGHLPFDLSQSVDVPLSVLQRTLREKDPPTPSTRLRRDTGTATAVAARRGTDERALLRQLRGDLDRICMKALEKDPARRYGSVAEFAADLRRHLAHEPVLAGSPGPVYRLGRFVRRHRVSVTFATALGAIGAVGLVTALELAAVGRDFRLLLVAPEVEALVDDADALWPVRPELVGAYEDWMSDASGLLERESTLRRELEMRRETERPSETDALLARYLAPVVDSLATLRANLVAAEAVTPEYGWCVPRRIEFARALERGFAPGGEYAVAWAAHLPAIREDFPGFGVQRGLVPLGRDPVSGLWEFAHLASGPPARRVDGVLQLERNSGIVLVLLPGGAGITIGAQAFDEEAPHFDDLANRFESIDRGDEAPVLPTVDLEPFFIGKFEVTAAQWDRCMGPAQVRRLTLEELGEAVASRAPGRDVPVAMVGAADGDRLAARYGLVLPSEKEWEYAARAGTSSPWWTGPTVETLKGAENVLDEAAAEGAHGRDPIPPSFRLGGVAPWNDGATQLSPIGQYLPNPFGLYDVLGNVSEWTRTVPHLYGHTEDFGDQRMSRGGNFRTGPWTGRVSLRDFMGDPQTVNPAVGLRMARSVDAD